MQTEFLLWCYSQKKKKKKICPNKTAQNQYQCEMKPQWELLLLKSSAKIKEWEYHLKIYWIYISP